MNDSVVWNVVRSEGAAIPFKVERDGKVLAIEVVPLHSGNERVAAEEHAASDDSTRNYAINRPGATKDSPAAQAGLKPGDIIKRSQRCPHLQPRRPGR